MHDILPEDARWHDIVRQSFERTAESYRFGRIETPVLEQQEVFEKGIGAATDIVEKELYTLRTKGGDKLALRPEGTAPIVRAYIEHGMKSWPQPVRLWYYSAMFRHERPQKGRYRQFWQAGFEILGETDAVADAEIVLLTLSALKEVGLKNIALQVNSIGDKDSRLVYIKVLKNYLKKHKSELAPNDQKRIIANPMRVLDSKDERTQRALTDAPEILDYLNEPDRAHLRMLLEYLEELEIPYLLNPRLVRGLDYYSRTVFEVWPEVKEGEEAPRQSALASGGRYDTLFRPLGMRPLGAVGVAIGIERVIATLKEQGGNAPDEQKPELFLAQLGEQAKRKALPLYEELRTAKFRVQASFGRTSIKSQLRAADRVGAKYVLILGQKEVADGTVIVRSMARGAQETIKREKLIAALRRKLKSR